MATQTPTDQLMDLYRLVQGKYLIAEVRYISTYYLPEGWESWLPTLYKDKRGVLINVYQLAEALYRKNIGNIDWDEISAQLQRFFPIDLSMYAILKLFDGINDTQMMKVARQIDKVGNLINNYTMYMDGRVHDLKKQSEDIQEIFDALKFYVGNAAKYQGYYNIARSKLEVMSRDLEIVFDQLPVNVYDTQEIFQQLTISEEFPFAIMLNYNKDQQLLVYDQFRDWSPTAQSRIQATIEQARLYIQKKAKKLSEVIENRWEHTVDAFQIDPVRFPRLEQQLRSFIILGLRSDWKRNVDMLIIKFGETNQPLTARVNFPNTIQPDLKAIEEILDQQLFPEYPRVYQVHRYRGTVNYFGVHSNPHLFPHLLIPPLDTIWKIDESRTLLANRHKVSFIYRHTDQQIGYSVSMKVNWAQHGYLPSEQTIVDHFGYELTFPQGTPFSSFNFIRGKRIEDLERGANQLQLILIAQELLMYRHNHVDQPISFSNYGELTEYERIGAEEMENRWDELIGFDRWFKRRYPGSSLFDVKISTVNYQTKQEKRITKLRQVAPDIIDTKYPVRCTGKLQPDVEPYRRGRYRIGNKRVIHLPIDEPEYTFICDTDDYPYATLVYADQTLYPCCSEHESSLQIDNVISAYMESAPSARTRHTTIKPLDPGETGIISSRFQQLFNLSSLTTSSYYSGDIASDKTIVRVGVNKQYNLLSATYMSLTGRQLDSNLRQQMVRELSNIEPSILMEQNWIDPKRALQLAIDDQMTYQEHFRLVMEVIWIVLKKRINLLAITGQRNNFEFIYPNYHRILTWRPNPEHTTVIVYQHPGNIYDAIGVRNIITISPYKDSDGLVRDLFTNTIQLLSPMRAKGDYPEYFQRELPDNITIVSQQLDREGHQVAVAAQWGPDDPTIYYFLTNPGPPANVPTFETFDDAPQLAIVQDRLSDEPGNDEQLLITTTNFKRNPVWSEVIGVSQNNWYMIGFSNSDEPVIDPSTDEDIEIITLPIARTGNLDSFGNQFLDVYYTATWLKRLIVLLLHTYRKKREAESTDDDIRNVVSDFIREHIVEYEGIDYPDIEQITTVDIVGDNDVSATLNRLRLRGVSYVIDDKLAVPPSVYAKLPEFCLHSYYAVPRSELKPPEHKSLEMIRQLGHMWFNQQTTLDMNELIIQVHDQIPKTGTLIYIRSSNENAVYSLQRYDSLDDYVIHHPELFHKVIKVNLNSYTNGIITGRESKNHRYPSSQFALNAAPEAEIDAIITSGAVYVFVERYDVVN